MWQARPPMWKRALWSLVPLLGLIELGAHVVDARRAPREAQWTEAAPGIRALRTDHELVVVAPEWAEPWARHVLGDELMPLADVARPDVSAYPRAIEVSILGEQAAELSGWTVKRQERHGKFRYRVLENPESGPCAVQLRGCPRTRARTGDGRSPCLHLD